VAYWLAAGKAKWKFRLRKSYMAAVVSMCEKRRIFMFRDKAFLLARLLREKGKSAFIYSLPQKAKVLDVGCGNNSPIRFKTKRPDCYYIGLDVADYNQEANARESAQEYILTEPEHFPAAIRRFECQVDAVISSHNLEHCEAPAEVMDAMLKCLKPGSRLYLSFPCEESVRFPKRRGTLNFFDDPTHKVVPNWENTISKIAQEGLVIDFCAKRYRPRLLAAIGLLLEPWSALVGRVASGTWALYGFESVIWAFRPKE
jgi:SAM-dependent methyltransferase